MKPEIIEFKDEEIAIYDLPETEEGCSTCDITVVGAFRLNGKKKALIVVLPQHSNEIPSVINIGLNQREITRSRDILEHVQRYGDQYGNIGRELLHET